MNPPVPTVSERPAPEWAALSNGVHVRSMIEGNGVSILLYRIEPGHRFARHQHPYPELGVVLVGRGRALFGDEERTLREADSYYFPAGMPHSFTAEGEGPTVVMGVTIPLPPGIPGPLGSDVIQRAKKLVRGARAPRPARRNGEARAR